MKKGKEKEEGRRKGKGMDFCMDMYGIHIWVRNFSNQILCLYVG